jgi:hypothetical protein
MQKTFYLITNELSSASIGRGRYNDSPSLPEPREYITIPDAPKRMPVHEAAFNPAPVDDDFGCAFMRPAGKGKKNRVRKILD